MKPVTNWVIADLSIKEGRALVMAALKQMVTMSVCNNRREVASLGPGSADYLSARLGSLADTFLPTPIFFSFFPQCGAWSQAILPCFLLRFFFWYEFVFRFRAYRGYCSCRSILCLNNYVIPLFIHGMPL